MTREEAAKIAAVISATDDIDSWCPDRLVARFSRKFPEFDWATLVQENNESVFKGTEPADQLSE